VLLTIADLSRNRRVLIHPTSLLPTRLTRLTHRNHNRRRRDQSKLTHVLFEVPRWILLVWTYISHTCTSTVHTHTPTRHHITAYQTQVAEGSRYLFYSNRFIVSTIHASISLSHPAVPSFNLRTIYNDESLKENICLIEKKRRCEPPLSSLDLSLEKAGKGNRP
jgi:hypothetical protein